MSEELNRAEREYIEMEAARIDSSERYFNARPQFNTVDRRKVFESGFDRGWQAALSAKSVPEQMGSPIQKLMEYLTNILDEDEFNQCDSILAGQGISAPKPTDDRVRELEKLEECRDFLLELNTSGFLAGESKLAKHLSERMETLYHTIDHVMKGETS